MAKKPKKEEPKKGTGKAKAKAKGRAKVEKKPEPKYTRLDSFVEAVRKAPETAKTIEEIGQAMIDNYSKHNPDKTPSKLDSAIWAARDYVAPLVAFKVMEQTGGKFKLLKG